MSLLLLNAICYGFEFHSITLPLLDSVYDSVAYDPVKTGLPESEAEVEEPANHKAQNRALSLVYSSASTCDSDNAVFT